MHECRASHIRFRICVSRAARHGCVEGFAGRCRTLAPSAGLPGYIAIEDGFFFCYVLTAGLMATAVAVFFAGTPIYRKESFECASRPVLGPFFSRILEGRGTAKGKISLLGWVLLPTIIVLSILQVFVPWPFLTTLSLAADLLCIGCLCVAHRDNSWLGARTPPTHFRRPFPSRRTPINVPRFTCGRQARRCDKVPRYRAGGRRGQRDFRHTLQHNVFLLLRAGVPDGHTRGVGWYAAQRSLLQPGQLHRRHLPDPRHREGDAEHVGHLQGDVRHLHGRGFTIGCGGHRIPPAPGRGAPDRLQLRTAQARQLSSDPRRHPQSPARSLPSSSLPSSSQFFPSPQMAHTSR